MRNADLEAIRKRIERIKSDLSRITDMRPGSLTLQYKNPKNEKGAYYQLSYTRDMRSRTEYVPRDYVPKLQSEIENYKRFKTLTDEWIALSIELSRLMMKGASRRR